MSDLSVQPFFIFSPDFMSWEDWNGNLLISYGELAFPYNTEDDWQQTAKAVAGNPAMAAYPVPDPDTYEDWRVWANDFTEVLNGQSY